MRTLKRKGVSSITGTVMGVIVVAVFMVIGIYILSSIQSTMPTVSNDTNPQANQTITNVWQSTYQAYGLLPIVLIVLVAAAIIGVLLRGFGARE